MLLYVIGNVYVCYSDKIYGGELFQGLRNTRLTNKFYKKNFYKMMWYNMVKNEVNLNFEKLNHITAH